MSDIAELTERIDALTSAVHAIAGTRLTREQVCERLDVCDKTLRSYIRTKGFPQEVAGRFLLTEVMEWERLKSRGQV